MFKGFKRNILAPLFLLLCITDAPLNATDEVDIQVDHVLDKAPGVMARIASRLLPPLAACIIFGNKQQVEDYITQNNIDVNAPIPLAPWQENIFGANHLPIDFAIGFNRPQMAALMLKLGGDVTAREAKKMLEAKNITHLCFLPGRIEELLEVIIKYCGIPNFCSSPYFEAIKNNDINLVNFLLKHKIPANLQESQGYCTISPIECAIEENNRTIIETLFKYGQACIGNTPIPTETLFAAANSIETLVLLEKYTKLEDISSLELFKRALKTNDCRKIATLLQYRKDLLDLNKKISEEGGNTLLHIAVKQTSKAGIIALLNKGADINAENNAGLRPLDYANSNDIHAYLTSVGATEGTPGLLGKLFWK